MMCSFDDEIDKIKNQIIKAYLPEKIILFGSCAKGVVTEKSDIDICIVLENNNKRELAQRIIMEIEYEHDLEVVIYTPTEWEKHKNDTASFANLIQRTGVTLYG